MNIVNDDHQTKQKHPLNSLTAVLPSDAARRYTLITVGLMGAQIHGEPGWAE